MFKKVTLVFESTSENSFDRNDFNKYNSIIPKIDYNFHSYFNTSQYSFDKCGTFKGLNAENSYGEHLKIDNSYNLEFKEIDHHDMDNNIYYNYIFSDNKSLEIKKEKLLDDKKIIYDEQYDINGNLISSKKGDITIFKKDGNKDIYYTDDNFLKVILEVSILLLIHIMMVLLIKVNVINMLFIIEMVLLSPLKH